MQGIIILTLIYLFFIHDIKCYDRTNTITSKFYLMRQEFIWWPEKIVHEADILRLGLIFIQKNKSLIFIIVNRRVNPVRSGVYCIQILYWGLHLHGEIDISILNIISTVGTDSGPVGTNSEPNLDPESWLHIDRDWYKLLNTYRIPSIDFEVPTYIYGPEFRVLGPDWPRVPSPGSRVPDFRIFHWKTKNRFITILLS